MPTSRYRRHPKEERITEKWEWAHVPLEGKEEVYSFQFLIIHKVETKRLCYAICFKSKFALNGHLAKAVKSVNKVTKWSFVYLTIWHNYRFKSITSAYFIIIYVKCNVSPNNYMFRRNGISLKKSANFNLLIYFLWMDIR